MLRILCCALLVATSVLTPSPLRAVDFGWLSLALLDRDRALWLAAADGSAARAVVTELAVTAVTWSPEGGRLAFAGLRGGTSVVGTVITTSEPIVQVRGEGSDPVWSGDGRWLAWRGDGEVIIANRDGAVIQRLEIIATHLEWSPDGQWLVFTRPLPETSLGPCRVTEVGWIHFSTGRIRLVDRVFGQIRWAHVAGQGGPLRLIYSRADDPRLWWADPGSGTKGLLWDGFAETCRGPLLTSQDGQWLAVLDAAGQGDDLVLINHVTREVRRVSDLPLGYPGQHLPYPYLWLDPLARFLYVARSFPTVVTRVDLVSGAQSVAAEDPGILVAISPEGRQLAFVRNFPGKPPTLVIVVPGTSQTVTLERMGWAAWEPAPYAPLAFTAIHRTWEREDRPVAAGAAVRSWLWGPQPLLVTTEPYREAPGGRRLVVYWDKARMEVTTLSGDWNSQWYVTNGLLVKELITGQRQEGGATFIPVEPAAIPVAGDLDDRFGPTYATFQALLTVSPLPLGSEILWRVRRDGSVTPDGPGGVTVAVLIPETNHTIADVFWEFLRSEERVWGESGPEEGRLFDPVFFVTGLPITEPYWATVKSGGEVHDVLIQCFERRCLTYTPSNPVGWQVEMGNVGQHYLAWRYGR